MSAKRILIVDGEPKNVSLLREVLSSAGYASTSAAKGEPAIATAALERPDLVIVDVELPGEVDGFEVIRRIRGFSEVPILVLSAVGDAEAVLRGFELGCDDYLTKPYDPRILLAHLQAVLKRSAGQTAAPAVLRFEGLEIDRSAQRVTLDGAEVYLTETEFNLLRELAGNQNRVLTHEYLLKTIWGAQFRSEVAYLRSYVHMLRQKIERNPSQPRLIISRPGIGYMFVAPAGDR